MEIEDVLVAKIVFLAQTASNSLKILVFKTVFSVAASTTKSTFLTPSASIVKVVIFDKVSILSAADIFSLSTIRSKFLEIVAIPLSKEV